ncbi:MAG: dNTP triphosphohydrolase [Chthonomonas sp.]|nr:dNTP triphosphohydrolase [Chthonomonas sp.]
MDGIRQATEAIEAQTLSPHACLASQSAGRERSEAPDEIRTCFQRDRDRILHSKAFRRLKRKTQVFIAPAGDHYRTRLTHTLEVAQIARTISRALRLNEDLTEAIALGHDTGHPPFGHAGEAALDEAVRERGGDGFRHYDQSIRVLTFLEPLNLSVEVLDGIRGHSKGERDLALDEGDHAPSWESAVVRISDRIAYLNHDLEDAIRSGMIEGVPGSFSHLGATSGPRIGKMVLDVVRNSNESVRLSSDMLADMNGLKDWMFENVYFRYPALVPEIEKSKLLVRELFAHFAQTKPIQEAVDYVAGMTDTFAIAEFDRLRVPKGFASLGGLP